MIKVLQGDCRDVLKTLPSESVHCVVTSPPYWGLRDYGVAGQLGLEDTPQAYVDALGGVFSDVRRVLRSDGTLWLNLGDSYAGGGRGGGRQGCKQQTNVGSLVPPSPVPNGLKPKDLVGIPWLVAFALRANGWYLRQDIIWAKPNVMPESVTDRCTKSHEYLFLLSKKQTYYYDAKAILEPLQTREEENYPLRAKVTGRGQQRWPGNNRDKSGGYPPNGDGRNKRSVWIVTRGVSNEVHFATFPPALIEPCIMAGCPKNGIVLDPFGGTGTTGLVADRLGRNAILIELNPKYAAMAERRVRDDAGMFAQVAAE